MDLTRFRPNVGVVLARADNKVWLGRRADVGPPRNWQFPQGGVDEGETPLEAAVRELREETGVTSARLIGQTSDWLAYEFPPEHAGSKIAKGWIGQKQIWFAMRFAGADSEIDLTGHHHVEFDAWRWADLAETPDLVAGFKEATYRKVVEIFSVMLATAL